MRKLFLLTLMIVLLMCHIVKAQTSCSLNSTNSTMAGTPVLHSLQCSSDVGLSGYIFSFDNGTGSFVNDTWQSFNLRPTSFDTSYSYGGYEILNPENAFDDGLNDTSTWADINAPVSDSTAIYDLFFNDVPINSILFYTWNGSWSEVSAAKVVLATPGQLDFTIEVNSLPSSFTTKSFLIDDPEYSNYVVDGNLQVRFYAIRPWVTGNGPVFMQLSDIYLYNPSGNYFSNVTKIINSQIGSTIRWKVYVNDSSNSWSISETFSYTTTSPLPVITIISPLNTTYINDIVALEFVVDRLTTWIGYSLDGRSNVTISGNSSLIGLSDGPHNIIVYATDSLGNTGKSQIFFTLNIPWTIEPFTMPQDGLTINNNLYIFARVNRNGNPVSQGIVNYTLDGINGNLYYYYNDDEWFVYNPVNLTEKKLYTLNVTGYYNSLYKGSGTSTIDVGNLKVLIKSMQYKVGTNFTISSEVFLGSQPQSCKAYYRIRNYSFYTILSGELDCFGNICNKTIVDITEAYPGYYYFLEVTANNSTIAESGGNFTLLEEWEPSLQIRTDKSTYYPGDTVRIEFISDTPLDNATFRIWDLFYSPIQFDRINSTYWAKNYTLGTTISGGYYDIDAYAYVNGENYYDYDSFYVSSTPPYEINLTIDKDSKRPGETIKIDVESTYYRIYQANLTIRKPDGSLETPSPLIMNNVSLYEKTRNYTLGLSAVEGEYTINVKANLEGVIREKNITFRLEIWDLFIVLNKYLFNSDEELNLTINVLNIYPPNLNFTTYVNITDPTNFAREIYRNYSMSNTYYVKYKIPENYTNGTSTIKIFLNDSYSRTRNISIVFWTSITNITNISNITNETIPFLSVSPSILSEITTIGKSFQRKFVLENTAPINISNIGLNISDELKTLVSLVSKPDSMLPKTQQDLILKIDTTNLNKGNYSGFIYITSSNGNPQLYMSIEVVGNLALESEESIEQLKPIEDDIGLLENQGKDTEELSTLLNDVKQLFNEAIKYYNSEDYLTAKVKLESAYVSTSELRDKIDAMKIVESSADYSFIIWIFVGGVVICIGGIVFIKYIHKGEIIEEVYSRKNL